MKRCGWPFTLLGIYIYIYVYIYVCVCVCVRACVRACVRVYVVCVCVKQVMCYTEQRQYIYTQCITQ